MTSLSPSRHQAQEIQMEVRKLKELYSAKPHDKTPTPASTQLRTMGTNAQLRASSSAQLLDAIRSGPEAKLNKSCTGGKGKISGMQTTSGGSNRVKASDTQLKPSLKTIDVLNTKLGKERPVSSTPNAGKVKSVLKMAKAEPKHKPSGKDPLDVLISKAEHELRLCAAKASSDVQRPGQTHPIGLESDTASESQKRRQNQHHEISQYPNPNQNQARGRNEDTAQSEHDHDFELESELESESKMERGEGCESFANTVREVREQAAMGPGCAGGETKLRADLEKWREFGYLLAESYDQLKKNVANERSQHVQDAEIVRALKEQVTKLKTLLKHSYKENEALRAELASRETLREQYVVRNVRPDLPEEYKALQKENDKLLKLLAAVTKEKDILDKEKLNSAKLVQQLSDKIKVHDVSNPDYRS
jgi:hypothetical protein